MNLGTLDVGDTQTVRDLADEHGKQVIEVDGWLHVTIAGTVYKAEGVGAAA